MLSLITNLSTIKKYLIFGGLLLSIVGFASYKLYSYHIEAIDTAVNSAENTLLLEQEQLINQREEDLLELANLEKQELESRISQQSKTLKDLERQLLVDHDLDRLLQAKPDMIINIVNNGTNQFYLEVEEVTK